MNRGTYRISDVALSSDIAMPELPAVADPPDWSFTTTTRRLSHGVPRWFHRWRNPGESPTLSFSRPAPGHYLLRFHGRADFSIDIAGRSIAGLRRGRATHTTLRHLLIDQIMPLVLSRERLVLHASAVATPSGAAAFVGFTGSGKSTLAAALAGCGFPLLADDCLVVETSGRAIVAQPFYAGARLWPDSVRAVGKSLRSSAPVAHYTRKRRLDASHLACQPVAMPLSRIFILDRPSARGRRASLELTRLRGADAVVALLECTFQLDIHDADAVRRTFERQSHLVRALPVHRLSYPWQLARLAEVRGAIARGLRAPR
jgi:hypothetical protein